MKKKIWIDKNRIVYCSRLMDGRIEKVLLKKINTIIYVCEECEATWLSLDGIFTEEDATAFMPYIESLGLMLRGVAPDWKNIIEIIDFVRFDDVECLIEKYGIEIVGSYCQVLGDA